MKRLCSRSGLVLGILWLGVTNLATAGLFGFGGDSWQEEVLLHDGRKLLITRSQTYGGRHEIGQPSPIKEHTVTFGLPGSDKTLTWTSEYGEELGRTNFHLLAVHVLNGTPYLVTEPNLCPSYNKWGRPNPPYVFFKYDGSAWQRIRLEELPTEFTTLNVAISLDMGHVKEMIRLGVVSAEEIRQRNSRLSQPEFRALLRLAVAANGISQTSCPIPTTAGAKLITPEVDGKPLYYNWWPLAAEWLKNTYGKVR
mgnify:CR=1 FL=1